MHLHPRLLAQNFERKGSEAKQYIRYDNALYTTTWVELAHVQVILTQESYGNSNSTWISSYSYEKTLNMKEIIFSKGDLILKLLYTCTFSSASKDGPQPSVLLRFQVLVIL